MKQPRGSSAAYVVIWEFEVPNPMKKRFETAYGPAGDWARLFGRSPDYLGTKLSADVLNPGCYLTMDYWTSPEAYEQFRRGHATEYEAIDAKCEELTEAEREIGRFRRLV